MAVDMAIVERARVRERSSSPGLESDGTVTLTDGSSFDMSDVKADGEYLDADKISKYKDAARVADKALAAASEACIVGQPLHVICAAGDAVVAAELAKMYTKGQVEKGPAFPTCVSRNNLVQNMSPGPDADDAVADGDLLKLCLGVQVDGMTVMAGTTVSVGDAVADENLNAMLAARDAAVVVNGMLKPGVKSAQLVEAIECVAKKYSCSVVSGVACRNMKRFIPDGNKEFLIRGPGPDVLTYNGPRPAEAAADEFEIADSEVYDINIAMSTGDGKVQAADKKTCVFKRNLGVKYMLRAKSARAVFVEINAKYPTMPFAVRQLATPKARLGLFECVSREVMVPYPVTVEKTNSMVASYRFTAIVRSGKTTCLAKHAMHIRPPSTGVHPAPAELFAGTPYEQLLKHTVPKDFKW